MPNKVSLQPGLYYHIFNRGNNRQLIFREVENYRYFLQLGKKYLSGIADVYCYALLPDHFHLLVRIGDETELTKRGVKDPKKISLQFGHWFNAYAKAFNRKYKQVSSLFEDRFERSPITTESHFDRIICYIHWNPQRHGLVEDFRMWDHSSFKSLLSQKPTLLARKTVMDWFGGREAFIEAHHSQLDLQKVEWNLPD